MAGEGISSLILLSASLIVAGIVATSIIVISYHYADSIKSRGSMEEQYLKSKIVIINDLAYSPYNKTTDNLTLYVKNIGYTVLSMNNTAVILNGTLYSLSYPYTIHPTSGDVWAPQVVVEIKIHLNSPLSNGDHIVTVVSDYGVKDTLTFRV